MYLSSGLAAGTRLSDVGIYTLVSSLSERYGIMAVCYKSEISSILLVSARAQAGLNPTRLKVFMRYEVIYFR